MCRPFWFLDPGGWSKTAVRLYFIFPGICTLSLPTYGINTSIHLCCSCVQEAAPFSDANTSLPLSPQLFSLRHLQLLSRRKKTTQDIFSENRHAFLKPFPAFLSSQNTAGTGGLEPGLPGTAADSNRVNREPRA
ncbi:hypothetical protein STEG23_014054 [Scotinomys teguina]